MIWLWLACFPALWLITLLRENPAWVRGLNRAGADIGRAVAWFCSGGLGWMFARPWLERSASDDRLDALMIESERRRMAPPADYDDGPARQSWLQTRLAIERASYAQGSHGLAQHIEAQRPGSPWWHALAQPDWSRPGLAVLAWLCPECSHGNHGCQPGRCRCPGRRGSYDGLYWDRE